MIFTYVIWITYVKSECENRKSALKTTWNKDCIDQKTGSLRGLKTGFIFPLAYSTLWGFQPPDSSSHFREILEHLLIYIQDLNWLCFFSNFFRLIFFEKYFFGIQWVRIFFDFFFKKCLRVMFFGVFLQSQTTREVDSWREGLEKFFENLRPA